MVMNGDEDEDDELVNGFCKKARIKRQLSNSLHSSRVSTLCLSSLIIIVFLLVRLFLSFLLLSCTRHDSK